MGWRKAGKGAALFLGHIAHWIAASSNQAGLAEQLPEYEFEMEISIYEEGNISPLRQSSPTFWHVDFQETVQYYGM